MSHLPEILLSNLFLVAVWAFFELGLRNTRNFHANRFFLLAGAMLAAVLPWLPWQISIPVHTEAILGIPMAMEGEIITDNPIPGIPDITVPNGTPVNWPAVIYFSVVVLLVLTFMAQTIRMFIWTRRRPVSRWDRYRVVEMNKSWPAFSFFSTIYFPEPFEPDKRETITILEHERVHARQLHSIDNILLLAVRILFFYNPAVHLLAGRLRLTHEFLADAATAGADKAGYSQTLIRHQFLVPRLLLMHSFNNQSFLTRRLNMLLKNNTHSRARWIYLLAVPLAAGMIVLSGWSASAQDADKKAEVCDEMPQFQGGSTSDFNRWVMKNLSVNMPPLEDSVNGFVVVSYVVSSTGKVKDVNLKQGLHPIMDDAVLKAISSSPDWKPGKLKGKAVDVPLTIKMDFFYRGKKDKNEVNAIDPAISDHKEMKTCQVLKDQPGFNSPEKQDRKVFQVVEDMPTFQGGTIESFRQWIQSTVNYPDAAREKNISGTEYVSFIVDTTGRVVDPQILRSADPILDAEIMRVLCSAPLWKPGKQVGRLVNVSFSIPVKFLAAEPEDEQAKKENDHVFQVVDQMPTFQGGKIDDFRNWVQNNIKYPAEAKSKKTEGTVFVSFVVDTTGNPVNVQSLRSVDPDLEAEVIRAIKSCPPWKPGKQRGKAVNVSFSIPISFVLSKSGDMIKPPKTLKEPVKSEDEDMKVFEIVEEMPEFDGGTVDKFRNWAQTHVKYPQIAMEKSISGTIDVSFVVGKTGEVKNVSVPADADPSLAKAVIDVVKSSPAWKPGMQRNKPVNVAITIQIKFILN